jgi:hypothetical protein
VTFKEIQSNVLQGSKVVLDVEEEYLDERTILTLDAATRITSSGIACFSSLDGKQHCFENALPGQCESENSFGPEGRRHLEDLGGQSVVYSLPFFQEEKTTTQSTQRTSQATTTTTTAGTAATTCTKYRCLNCDFFTGKCKSYSSRICATANSPCSAPN